MSGGGTQHSLRKALGAIKDTTTVSLAKVNSDYKVDFNNNNHQDGYFNYGCSFGYGFFHFAGIGYCYSEGHKSLWTPSEGEKY